MRAAPPTSPPASLDDAWASLASGAPLLTASAGLAARLAAGYDRWALNAGRRTWASADILPWTAWLARIWTDHGDRRLLSPAQELAVWEQAIIDWRGTTLTAKLEAASGLNTPRIAAAAASAWQLFQAWQLPWPDDTSRPTWGQDDQSGHGDLGDQRDGPAAFDAWATWFARRCVERGWITAAELPEAITNAVARRPVALPSRLWLAGFDEHSPRQQAWLDALRVRGCTVADWPRPSHLPHLQVWGAPNEEAELRAAARWARRRLHESASGIMDGRRTPRIAVVVPELARLRSQVEQIFGDELEPRRAPWDESPSCFHISLGIVLTDCPVIAAALSVLACPLAQTLEMSQAGALATLPYLASTRELPARAQWWRKRGSEQRSSATLAMLHDEMAWMFCPQFAAAMTRLQNVSATWPERQSARAWAVGFSAALEAAGWPGDGPLTGAEHRALRAWSKLLDEFCGLDAVADSASTALLSASAAVTALRRLADAHIFQPQRRAPSARIEVLGWLEAGGQEFRHLWISGLHDGVLPAPAAPHPLLPRRLQAELDLPHASHAREAAFAGRIWDRLLGSSPEVIASFPRLDGEETLRPSPLLAASPALPDNQIEWAMKDIAPATTDCELLEDWQAPPAGVSEASGGTGLLKSQAACGFQAFAHRRLHANGLEAPPTGLSRLTRGNLLHALLKGVWETLEDSAALDALSVSAEAALLGRCAQAALDQPEPSELLRARPALAALERERLVAIGHAWLAVERKRKEAFRVLAEELDYDAEFAGVQFHLRLDRMDEIEGGGRFLLDYKSGEPDIRDWETPRPKEPQLPLYLLTVSGDAPITGMAFAQLKPGNLRLKAVTRADDPETWAQRIEAWRAELTTLARQYLDGHAAVDPKEGHQTCQYCDLDALCRIAEATPRERPAPWDEPGGGEGGGDA